METETTPRTLEGIVRKYATPLSIIGAGIVILLSFVAGPSGRDVRTNVPSGLAASEVVLPLAWGDLGAQMVAAGVIDRAKFEALYAGRGGLSENERRLLLGNSAGRLVVTQENAGFVLNLLWALGLGNKNSILEKGQMADPRYGGADRFASTGGWTLAKGDAMKHYSAHTFIALTAEQQTLVERISGNIYRPCCDNPAVFPDCNHGMAMLGLLELMASQGATEEQMYTAALEMNRFWFTGQYALIDQYLESKGRVSGEVSPKEILGKEYSSASGFARVARSVKGTPQGGGSCGT
ncbi:hypothetical protein HY972_00535 [Candidatus Kaiserbacteria bacterium]|nr:hypothetical protein [Candidatus Kaiserbacteria bacterium]